jgi:cytoskeletal protein CcmA (bactofilin family)
MGIFTGSDKVANEQSLASVIAKDTKVHGEIKVDNKLFVDGMIQGTVESSVVVTIGKEGMIDGVLKVNKLIVSGKAKGKIECDICEILAGGFVEGELTTRTLIVEDGGMLEGKTTMRKSPIIDTIQEAV